MAKVSISFIIHIYNREVGFFDYLKKFILKFEKYGIEFILIANGCTTEFNETLNNFYQDNPRINLFFKSVDALHIIRNMGIFNSSCDYLFFINNFDDVGDFEHFFDDISNESDIISYNNVSLYKKSSLNDLINKNEEILLLTNQFFFYYIHTVLNYPMGDFSKDTFSIEEFLINFNIIKRSLVKSNLWYEKEDEVYDFFSNILLEKISSIDEANKKDVCNDLDETLDYFLDQDSCSVFKKMINCYGSTDSNNKHFSIIIPCYNMENYIKRTINSIINQKNINFDDIEIIIVDDGSLDGTSRLCHDFVNQYPDNIKYIYQENQGQAIAKNNALKYANGDFIYFLDADDYLIENTLINVYDFFKNNSYVDLVAIPLFILDENTGNIFDDYTCSDLSIIDLNKQWHYPLFSSSSVFFRRNILYEYAFEDYRIFEDKLFINKILISENKYGFVNIGGVCCCKRSDGFSISQRAMFDKFSYIKQLLMYFNELIEYCLDNRKAVPKFIQNVISHESKWFLYSENILNNLTFNESKYLTNCLKDIFYYIDNDVINYCLDDNNSIRKAIFNLKHGSYLIETDDRLFKYSDNSVLLDTLNIHRIYIDIIKIKNNHIFISGFFKSFFDSDDVDIVLEKRGNHVEYYSAKIVEYSNRKKSSFLESYINFDFEIPIDNNETSVFKIYVAYNESLISLNVVFMNHARMSEISNYSIWQNHLIEFKDNSFYLFEYSYLKMIFLEFHVLKRIFKRKGAYWTSALFFRLLYLLVYPFYRNKEIWLFMDKRETADDNAIHLFKYSLKMKDNIKKYYTLSKDSKHFGELKKLKNILSFYSIKQRLIFLLSDKIISSHPDESVLNPFFNKNVKLYSGLINSEKIFLQHGVTKDNVSRWLRRYDKDLSLLVTVSDREAISFLDQGYNYDEEIIHVLGFPRFDNLNDESNKRQILIMPSWRRQLENLTIDEIKQSQYFIKFNSLLNDEKLINFLKQNDYKIIFRPHPKVLDFVELFDSNSQVIIDTDSKYQVLFNNSSLLISDYSSVSFDFAYIKKPVLYYHYADDYHFKDSYFDYEEMGFGEVITSHDDLVEVIIDYVNNDCAMKEEYIKNVENFFKFIDKNNCKRVYESIKKL